MKISGKLLLKVGISLGLLIFFLVNTGIDKTFQELSNANLWYLPLGVLLYLLSQLISAYRWQFLSKPLGFNLAFREFFDYYMLGMFFSLFLPGAIGGDVSRVYYLAKSRDRKKREALLTLLAERGVGLVALLILTASLCLLPVTAPIPPLVRMTMVGLAVLAFLGFIAIRILPMERLAERFSPLQLLSQASIYWKDIPMLAKSIAISLSVQACMIGIQMLLMQALDMHVPLLYLTAVYGVVSLLSVLPISFNGIGVREGAYMYLLQQGGVPPHTGLAFGLYWFLVSAFTSILGGLVLVKGHYKTPPMEASEPSMADKSLHRTV